MTLLPVVERELRIAARRRGAFWSRVGACLLLLCVMLWLLWVAGDTFYQPQRSGRGLFGVLCGLTFVLCLGIGGSLTADCLSSEKREGTLGLLFLTDLRGHDVVLGKLVATSLAAFYALLAVLPLLALPVLLGGLTSLALIGMAVCLVNTMFFSLTAGLFISAISRDERRAIGGALALVLGITLGLPFVGMLLEELTGLRGRHGVAEMFSTPSPLYGLMVGLQRLLDTTPGGPSPAPFWVCQVWVHGLGWLFLLLACVVLPRTWHETGNDQAPGANLGRWWRLGKARAQVRGRLLELCPTAWLTLRYRARVLAPQVLLGLGLALWLAGELTLRAEWHSAMMAVVFALGLQTVFKYQVAAEACRRFAEDRRSGALELLLSTPLTAGEIVRGQWLALGRIFGLPLLALLAGQVLLLATAWRDAGSEAPQLAAAFVVNLGVTALDCVALAWLGMWSGLRARSYTVALGQTFGWIQCLPWMVWGLVTFTVIALELFGGVLHSDTAAGFTALLVGWTLVCVVFDGAAILWARWGLAKRFAAEATGQSGRGASRTGQPK
jgi:ABC-type Na+ efflux pump permease subunit